MEQSNALEWISMIESEKSRIIREADIYPKLRAWVDSILPVSILEIVCGQGICSDQINLTGREYTGLDPSPILVERANHLYRSANRRFLPGDAFSLPFSEGAFDAAFSVSVWHLLEDLKKSADEMSRVLKPGGHFMIITANPGAYTAWTAMYTDTRLKGCRFEGKMQLDGRTVSHDVLYLHSLEEIKASLQCAHLEIQEVETFRPVENSPEQKRYVLIQGQKSSSV
jgi:SAM-dependent methyltransferase